MNRSAVLSLGRRWLPVAVWMIVIFALSAQPTLPLPGVSWLDEALQVGGHFTEYAILAYLISSAISPANRSSRWRLLFALVWCVVYAMSDEWHQSFVPGRDASLFDLAIDTLGASVGYWLFRRKKS